MKNIKFNCHNCDQPFVAPDRMSGDIINCPICQKPLRVPSVKSTPLPLPEPISIDNTATRHQATSSPFVNFIVSSFWWIIAVASLIKIVSYFIAPPGNATAGFHIGKLLVGFLSYGGILSIIALIVSLCIRNKQNVFRITFAILYFIACFITFPIAVLKAKVNSEIRDYMHSQNSSAISHVTPTPRKAIETPYADRHEGIIDNGQRHRQGVETTANGIKHSSELSNEELSGKGTKSYPDGSVYVGEFSHGQRHGEGTLTLPDGRQFSGNFMLDKLYIATVTFPDGRSYSGDVQGTQITGFGTMTWRGSDAKYEGAFENGRFHGEGTYKSSNTHYTGGWSKNQYHGFGTLKMSNGAKYVGEYENGKKHGRGTLTVDGIRYSGNWVNDRLEDK